MHNGESIVNRQGQRVTPRGAASRARLISAARAELVGRSGQLEVESVASRAGSSVGLVYRHFGSRAGLIGAVVDDFYARYRNEALEINPAPHASFRVRERKRIEAVVAFHYADPLARVIVLNLHLDAEVAEIETRHRREMIALAQAVIELGQRRGEVPADRDPEFIAALVIGGLREVLGVALSRTPQMAAWTVNRKLWVLVESILGVGPDS